MRSKTKNPAPVAIVTTNSKPENPCTARALRAAVPGARRAAILAQRVRRAAEGGV